MPLYNFRCATCAKDYKRILTVEQSEAPVPCKTCGATLARAVGTPTIQSKEVIDNGVMTQKLERFTNAEELFEEHSRH